MVIKTPRVISRSASVAIASASELIHQLRAEEEDYPQGSPERAMLEGLLAAAVEWLESYTGRFFIDAVIEFSLDAFPQRAYQFQLWNARQLQSVTYIGSDSAGYSLPLNQVDVDLSALRPMVSPKNGYPATASVFNAVKFRFLVGYVSSGDIPRLAKVACLMLAAHWHENASATSPVAMKEVPFGVKALADTLKVDWL